MVEDEQSITEPLSEALAREGFHTQVTGTVAGALELAARVEPDLVLLDVMLPDGSGYDVCRELRAGSSVPIIMLTARGEETDRIVGLELGADDYIVKPFSAREVVARIRAVLRRAGDHGAPPTEPIEIGPLLLDRAKRAATLGGEPLDLTRREYDLLELLMSEAGDTLAPKTGDSEAGERERRRGKRNRSRGDDNGGARADQTPTRSDDNSRRGSDDSGGSDDDSGSGSDDSGGSDDRSRSSDASSSGSGSGGRGSGSGSDNSGHGGGDDD